MKTMALIPARAGSKRLHLKNRQLLGGLALWQHAIGHARASAVIDHDDVWLTTNDDEIGREALRHCNVIRRPEQLARDDTSMFDVVTHALLSLSRREYDCREYELIFLLQPTSPFRTGEDLANCLRLMVETNAESVVSVSEGPDDLAFMVRHAGRLERLPKIVIPNGAIYLFRTETILSGRDWYNDFTYGYVMPRERALDINIQFDMETAERYLPRMKIEL